MFRPKQEIAAFAAAAGTAMIIYGSEPNDKTNGCPDVEKRFNIPENDKSNKVLVDNLADEKAASYLRNGGFISLKDGHGYPFLHSP